jgi:hypothetical protein
MNTFYLCWIDDQIGFVNSLKDRLDVLEYKKSVKIEVDEHNSTKDFDTIARCVDDDLIFLVDYNLIDGKGNSVNGNEIIESIRKHNEKCVIIFYSSIKSQDDLRKMIEGYSNIFCIRREDIIDKLGDILY